MPFAFPTDTSSKYEGRKKGERPSSQEIREYLGTAESREEAFQVKCTCRGRDCKRNLFTYEGSSYSDHVDGLKSTRDEFWKKNEKERGIFVFTELKLMYKHWDWDEGQTNPTSAKSFRFWVNNKPMCLKVWLAMHGISKSLYNRMRRRVIAGAHMHDVNGTSNSVASCQKSEYSLTVLCRVCAC